MLLLLVALLLPPLAKRAGLANLRAAWHAAPGLLDGVPEGW